MWITSAGGGSGGVDIADGDGGDSDDDDGDEYCYTCWLATKVDQDDGSKANMG